MRLNFYLPLISIKWKRYSIFIQQNNIKLKNSKEKKRELYDKNKTLKIQQQLMSWKQVYILLLPIRLYHIRYAQNLSSHGQNQGHHKALWLEQQGTGRGILSWTWRTYGKIHLFVSMTNKWYIKIKIKFYNVPTSEPLRQPSGLTRCPHFPGNSCAAATLMPASSALLLPLLLIMLHKHSGLSLITDLRGSQQLSGTSRLPLRYLRQGASRFRQ